MGILVVFFQDKILPNNIRLALASDAQLIPRFIKADEVTKNRKLHPSPKYKAP